MSIGSKQKSTTTAGEADPFVKAGLRGAQDLYNKGPLQQYQGPTVAGFNPFQNMALGGTAMRAAQGTPDTTHLASDALRSTLRGDFLNPSNPYTSQVTQGVMDSVIPRVQSMFTSAGRTGSNANMETLTKAATEAVAPHLFNQYGQERQNQMNALFQAPGFDQQAMGNDFGRYQAMLGAGDRFQAQNQMEIDAGRQQFDAQQMAPWQLQQLYQSTISPYASMYSQNTQKQSQSAIPMLIGGALEAAKVAFGKPPGV